MWYVHVGGKLGNVMKNIDRNPKISTHPTSIARRAKESAFKIIQKKPSYAE